MSPTMMVNDQRNRLNQIGRLGRQYARLEKFNKRSLIVATLAALVYLTFVCLKLISSVTSLQEMLRLTDSTVLINGCLILLCAFAVWALLAQGAQAYLWRKILVLLANYVPLMPEWHQMLLEYDQAGELTPRELLIWVREEDYLLQRGLERV